MPEETSFHFLNVKKRSIFIFYPSLFLPSVQIFLDPLCKVTSISVMEGILSLCATPTQRRFLQELGMCIGVRKWAEDVTMMWEEPGAEERRKKAREGDQGRKPAEDQLAMELVSDKKVVVLFRSPH